MTDEGAQPRASDFEVPSRLCVGIALATAPSTTRGLLEQLCFEIERATGIEVEARSVCRYEELLDGLAAGEVDVAWLPPVMAQRAAVEGRAFPIALPVRNGFCSYWAALFARSGSALRQPRDLVGVRAAWVDVQSASGYRIIRAYLRQQGVDLRRAFAQDRFFGSHDAVTRAVLGGEADVGATYAYFEPTGSDERRCLAAGWGEAEVQVVARAGPIPSDVVAIRRGVPALVVRLVQSALCDVRNAELREAARALLGADGFAMPTPEHLEPLYELLAGELMPSGPSCSIVPPARR